MDRDNDPSLLARYDWLALLIYQFPVPVASLFIGMFFEEPKNPDWIPDPTTGFVIGNDILASWVLAPTQILVLLVYACLIAVVGVIISQFWEVISPSSTAFSKEEVTQLTGRFSPEVAKYLPNMRYVKHTGGGGAHVRGFFKPYIIMSAATRVELLITDEQCAKHHNGRIKRDMADAVILHEASHIRHGDTLLFALMGIFLIEGVMNAFQDKEIIENLYHNGKIIQSVINAPLDPSRGFPIIRASLWVLYIPVLWAILSRYREYYADCQVKKWSVSCAVALLALRSEPRRRSFFHKVFSHIFHPSLKQRKAQFENGYRALKKGFIWKTLWIVQIFWSGIIILGAPDLTVITSPQDYHVFYAKFYSECYLLASIVLLACDALRGRLFRALPSEKLYRFVNSVVPKDRRDLLYKLAIVGIGALGAVLGQSSYRA